MTDLNQQATALDTYTRPIPPPRPPHEAEPDTQDTLACLLAGEAGPYLQHMTRNLLASQDH